MSKEFDEGVQNHLTYHLPEFFKDFLNWFVETRFYNKDYRKRADLDDTNFVKNHIVKETNESGKKYMFLDWECPNIKSLEEFDVQKTTMRFGTLPSYMMETFKYIEINLEERRMNVANGIAYGPWGSRRVKTERPTPKYMEERINKFWNDYDKWLEENNDNRD